MTVREYYLKHLDDLPEDKKFHFLNHLKNWYKTDEFTEELTNLEPSHDFFDLFNQKPTQKTVDNFLMRKPYFDKYKELFSLEASLFRLKYLLEEYNTDLRADFESDHHKEELYDLADTLLEDNAALASLSSYAINYICLLEILFPRGHNPYALLARKMLHFSGDPALATYLTTHIIICDSNFYVRTLTPENLPIYKPLVVKTANLIAKNLTKIPLEIKIKFLVASKIVRAALLPENKKSKSLFESAPTSFLPLKNKISLECAANLRAAPFLLDPRAPEKNDFDTAEHRNVLFILSGLDNELLT